MKKTSTNTYEKRGQASRYTVREGEKGWIIESWSNYTGDVSGRKVSMPFDEKYPRGLDLEKYYNEFMVYGDMLFEYSKSVGQDPTSNGRVLRKGHTVR